MTRTLKASAEALKQSDRRMSLELTGSAAGPILSRGRRAASGGAQMAGGGSLRNAMGGTLRQLAQSDARLYRGLSAEMKPKQLKGAAKRPRRLKPAN